jgi:hypothetical protein
MNAGIEYNTVDNKIIFKLWVQVAGVGSGGWDTLLASGQLLELRLGRQRHLQGRGHAARVHTVRYTSCIQICSMIPVYCSCMLKLYFFSRGGPLLIFCAIFVVFCSVCRTPTVEHCTHGQRWIYVFIINRFSALTVQYPVLEGFFSCREVERVGGGGIEYKFC